MIGRGRVVRPCRVLLGRLSVRVLRVQCLLCTLLCKRCADVSTTPAISEIGLRSAPECGRVEEEGHGTSCRNRQSRTYPGARSSRPFPPLPRRQTKRRSGPWLLVESAAVRGPRENSNGKQTGADLNISPADDAVRSAVRGRLSRMVSYANPLPGLPLAPYVVFARPLPLT